MKNIKKLHFIGLCSVLFLTACSLEMEDEDVALGKYTAPISDSTPGSAEVDLGDSTFDTGANGLWLGGGSALLTTEQHIVHAGDYSLKISERSAAEDGAVISFGEQLIAGNSYTVTSWVRLVSGDVPVSDIVKLVINFADDNGVNSIIVAEVTAADSQWVRLSGKFVYEPTGTVTSAPYLSIEGPASTQDFYIDTVVVTDHGNESAEGIPPIKISMASGWRTSAGDLTYTTDGASYQPTTDGQQLVFDMAGPLDLSAAEIIFTYKVDQAYIDSGSNIQPFAQAKQGNWTGHWSCYIGNGDLPAADEEGTYTCTLGNVDFNLLDETMGIQIGFQSKGSAINGTVTVTGVTIILPAPVSNDIAADTSSGWRVSEGLAVDYSADGVSFQPNTADQQLLYDVSGPANLSSADLVLVYTVDQAFIDSASDVQVFAQAKQGNWTGVWDCYIGNGDLPLANEDGTYTCSMAHDDFNLVDETMAMQFGVQVKGGVIAGKVTIKSMLIVVPD